MRNHRTELERHFGYLTEELGLSLVSFIDVPRAFDNFLAIYERGELRIRVIRDRSQVSIEFSVNGKPWQNKERILASLGMSRDRRSTHKSGLWEGGTIENQAQDLRKHFDLIVNCLTSQAAI